MNRLLTIALIIPSLVFAMYAQRELGVRPTATGGPLKFEEAVYDVQSYDVSIRADPRTKSISGTTVMIAKTVIPTDVILLDLDTPYTISKVTDGNGHDLKFERSPDALRIFFPYSKQVGEMITTNITYAGTPREAPRPPWVRFRSRAPIRHRERETRQAAAASSPAVRSPPPKKSRARRKS